MKNPNWSGNEIQKLKMAIKDCKKDKMGNQGAIKDYKKDEENCWK